MLAKLSAQMTTLLATAKRNENGATAVEYGLLVALIAGLIITAVLALSGSLSGLFNGMSTTLKNNTPK